MFQGLQMHDDKMCSWTQGRHGEFEPGKAQYSTPIFFDQLFFIRVYWNSKSRQGLGLGALPAVAALAHMYWEQWLAANLGPKHFKIVCLKHSCGIPSLCQVLNWSPICRKNLKLFSLLDLFIVFLVFFRLNWILWQKTTNFKVEKI